MSDSANGTCIELAREIKRWIVNRNGDRCYIWLSPGTPGYVDYWIELNAIAMIHFPGLDEMGIGTITLKRSEFLMEA